MKMFLFFGIMIIILGSCAPCFQKESRYYNPKVGEKCVPDRCTECFDLTKIR